MPLAFTIAAPIHLRRRRPALAQPSTRVAPRRAQTRAVLHDPRAKDDDQTLSKLRSDHLSAYFDADESMYQTRLASVLRLAIRNFAEELAELVAAFRRSARLDPPLRYTPPDCLNLALSDEAVANREREREFQHGELPAAPFVRFVYDVTCLFLDLRFAGRPLPRFWFLETVARMPYFAYTSCLHLFSTLGWFRSPTLMNMHHAEELNEAYHLAVMESLGGDKRWGVSFDGLVFGDDLDYRIVY